MNLKISLITCTTSDMYIGYNNNLIISLKPDMNYFKTLTTGHMVVMGKNTYLSLPDKKPLVNRINVIISTTMQKNPEGFHLFHNVEEFFKYCCDNNYDDEIFIIGGSKIYDTFMPFAEKIYLTYIHKNIKEIYHNSINDSLLTKFPASVYNYTWDVENFAPEHYCFDKNFGLIGYNFITLLRK